MCDFKTRPTRAWRNLIPTTLMGRPHYKKVNMKITERTFSGYTDLPAMAELVRKFPAENIHVVDLPYRFSSWSFDYPENIRLWSDEQGQLLAWAILTSPILEDRLRLQSQYAMTGTSQILKWADEQAHKIVNTPSGHPAWFVHSSCKLDDRIHDLEQAGFTSQANVGEHSWSQVLMEHSMQIPKSGEPAQWISTSSIQWHERNSCIC